MSGGSNIRPLIPADTDDATILAGIRDGRKHSYNLLYLKYAKRIYWLARRFLGDDDQARNVLQETFMRAFQRVSAFKGETGLGKWLYTIARNICLNELKRAERQRLSYVATDELEQATDGGGTGSDVRVERAELLARACSFIEELEPKKRMTFLLFYVDELTADEIGEVMGEGRGTILKRLQRTRGELVDRVREAGFIGASDAVPKGQEKE